MRVEPFRLASLALAVLLAAGCSAHQPPRQLSSAASAERDGAPCWVAKGGTCLQKDSSKRRHVYGVGSVTGTRNVGLAREAALARARTEIARTLQTQVKAMLKDYQATTTGGPGFAIEASDEQHIADVSRQITDLTLSGTELADSWISDTGATYVLCRLDVEGFKGTVQRMGELSEAVRKAVVDRADKAFEELDRETSGAH